MRIKEKVGKTFNIAWYLVATHNIIKYCQDFMYLFHVEVLKFLWS